MLIKYCNYKFESKEYVNGKRINLFLNQFSYGNLLGYSVEQVKSLEDVNVTLDTDKVYLLSLDQSTTCTGITIKSVDNTHLVLMEYKNDKTTSSDRYIYNLELLLTKLLHNIDVIYIIYEKPIKSKSYISTATLFRLEGMIRGLKFKQENLSKTIFDNMNVQAWRSRIILDMFRKFDKKLAVMYSLTYIYPWLEYYGQSINKDMDIYESFGIMSGYLCACNDIFDRSLAGGSEVPYTEELIVAKIEEVINCCKQNDLEYGRCVFQDNIKAAYRASDIVKHDNCKNGILDSLLLFCFKDEEQAFKTLVALDVTHTSMFDKHKYLDYCIIFTNNLNDKERELLRSVKCIPAYLK